MVQRWTAERAWAWFETQPWLLGCNYIPRTASNQLEMWQSETFDPATLDQELGWAASFGMNTVRVFLHDLLWVGDQSGLLSRIERYLAIAHAHGIRTLFVLFDDCWSEGARLGPQKHPIAGVHNSRWLQAPGLRAARRPANRERLEAYVRGVVSHFRDDDRVLGWDITNEVTNHYMVALRRRPPLDSVGKWFIGLRGRVRRPATLELMRAAFSWAREESPTQPLTAGAWRSIDDKLNSELYELSDIVTFHNYRDLSELADQVEQLRKYGRPILCTEWLARGQDSEIRTHLPYFRSQGVGCLNWGLVEGKTQTSVRWQWSTAKQRESLPWFHDLMHQDGSPYRPEEIDLLRAQANVARNEASPQLVRRQSPVAGD